MNRVVPTKAATSSAHAQRLPRTLIVWGNRPAAAWRWSTSDRRRVAAAGIDRGQEPLGPHCATTSFSLTVSPHDRQVSNGAKSPPQAVWRIPGSRSAWSGTQWRSHSQIDTSTGHNDRLRAVTRYSARGGFVW
ncbi:MAG: hypothetical protein ABWY20_03860 [Mycobacterium sp.]